MSSFWKKCCKEARENLSKMQSIKMPSEVLKIEKIKGESIITCEDGIYKLNFSPNNEMYYEKLKNVEL